MIELLVLHSLLQKDFTMYAIKKHIETVFAAFVTPSFGAINPALRKLEKKECIKSGKLLSEGGKVSIYYSITKKGREELRSLLLEDFSKNPSQFFLQARLKLVMAEHLTSEEKKRLFFIIKSMALRFKNQAKESQLEGKFYYNILLDNISCEYANLVTVVEGLEKDNARNSK